MGYQGAGGDSEAGRVDSQDEQRRRQPVDHRASGGNDASRRGPGYQAGSEAAGRSAAGRAPLIFDTYSSQRQYDHHIAPVWATLPPEHRGTFHRPESLRQRDPSRPVLVASYRDAMTMGGSSLIHLDHGAGQTYNGGDERARHNGSYAGGDGLDGVRLFLCASERVASMWRERYPKARAISVGVPKLDRYHGLHGARPLGGGVGFSSETRPPGLPTVAITFHSDLALCPETRSAWRYYDPHLPRLVTDPRWRVVGHGHPRLWPTIQRRWSELGVDHSPDPDVILSTADVLVADNTSLMMEAAALGIPCVCLNMPSYRRDVEHGGRFWSAVPGIQVDHPSELAEAIASALADPPAHRAMRERAVAWAYGGPLVPGAAGRAVTAIMEEFSNG